MEFIDILKNRRSIRIYTGESIPEDKLNQVLEAGLLAFSGRNIKPWEFVVVRDKDMLKKLAGCRPHGSQMLAGADAAIVVLADENKTDVWTEDCSIAMTQMHLMADYIGLGSCWIQGRLRPAPEDGRMAEDVLRALLHFPENIRLEAILSLGMTDTHPAPREVTEELRHKIHWDVY